MSVGNKAELIAQQLLTAQINRKTWGNFIYNPRDYGAKVDGVTDDSDAIMKTIIAGMGKGKVYIPGGIYLISQKILVDLTGTLIIEMDPNAVFRVAPGFNDKIIQIIDNGNRNELSWRGGHIDAIDAQFGVSNDSLWISGLGQGDIYGVTFLFGADYTVQKGDTGIAPVDCHNLNITNCWFYGAPDVGIYISGDGNIGGGDYADTVVSHCHFIKCNVGVGIKRETTRVTVSLNHFYRCSIGIQTAEATSGVTNLAPGKYITIIGNQFKFSGSRAIEVTLSDYSIVTGNRIEDFGKDLADTIIDQAKGIWLRGSKNCTVQGNIIAFVDWALSLPTNTRGIMLGGYTFESVAYNSTNNNVSGNVINSCTLGIREETASDGPNSIGINTVENCTTPVDTKHVSTVSLRHESSGLFKVVVGTTIRIEANANGTKFNNTGDLKGMLSGSFAVDFGSITANGNLEQTVTLTGAQTTDVAIITPQQSYSGGLEFFARVSAADTVTIRARNFTAAAIDPASLTLKVTLVRM